MSTITKKDIDAWCDMKIKKEHPELIAKLREHELEIYKHRCPIKYQEWTNTATILVDGKVVTNTSLRRECKRVNVFLPADEYMGSYYQIGIYTWDGHKFLWLKSPTTYIPPPDAPPYIKVKRSLWSRIFG